jgi:4-oxalocrotonate tautomerase
MPLIEVQIYENRITEQTRARLIQRLTDAVVEVFGEDIRPQTWVVLTPVPPTHWGIAGQPGGA